MRIADDKFIVVTGGAGCIGSNIIQELNNRGLYNILVVDDLGTDQKWKNLVGKRFLHLISKDKLFSWLADHSEEVESIVHMGACSDTTETDADYLLENNTNYSIALAEIALRHDYRFVYASSAATYGDGSQGFSDNHEGLLELQPLNMYGYSKHLFDLWAYQQGVLDQMVGLKYFNVFGPCEGHKGHMASAVYKMVRHLQSGGSEIQLFKSNDPLNYADGDQCRDFIYVKDAARMTCDFLENTFSGIYNIGRGEPTTWNTLAQAVLTCLEGDYGIRYVDMPATLSGQYQNYTCADMTKYQASHIDPLTKEEVAMEGARYSVEEAVRDYVQSALQAVPC